ncbi:MAG: protein-L-isoaspartate(D-aspartate) O-methyltransferase [Arenicellales bacterium]
MKLLTTAAGMFSTLLIVIASSAGILAHAADSTEQARLEMVRNIEQDVRETSLELNKSELDPRVMKALSRVPRHEFVPVDEKQNAYENRPLPIGHGQTISQPYIVAVMTDMLNLEPDSRVLELGTGSGYQAAILGELAGKVYTIEIVEPLGMQAKERLQRLGYDNVTTKVGDGYYGWEEHAPFDAIIVTAAASHIPPPLIKQLKPGGRMVIPVGSRFMMQQLLVVDKREDNKIVSKQVLPVVFVPVTGKH